MVEIKQWDFVTPGIPDICFTKDNIPLTKEEVRCLTICKARLKRNSIIYDIGAGTGSIAIEAALLAREGMVYAVEKEQRAAEIILKNAGKFGVNNLCVIQGEAPEALHELPAADRIIIGGSGKRLKDILIVAHAKLKAQGRVIINAVTMETLATSVQLLEAMALAEVSTCCLTVARVKQAGGSRIFQGLNPVFLVVGERGEP